MYQSRWIPIAAWALAATVALAEPGTTAPPNSNAALQEAIRQGDLARLKTLLDSGAEANAVDADGMPAIMNAAIYGSAQYLRLLIEHGANVNAKNSGGATALIYAAGDPEKARVLVAAGADVNVQSQAGRTALLTAATSAHGAPTVKLLLEKGAKVDARDNIDGIPVLFTGGGKATPLIEAARAGDVQTVRMLLLAGTDVNAKAGQGTTALTEATLFGRREIVKELLANNASVDVAPTVLKFPLLSLAAMRGDIEIARMLVKAGARVQVADVAGATPLMWAAYSERPNTGMVHFLIKAGADGKVRNKAGESALDWALQRGETRVARMLRAAGAPAKEAAPASSTPATGDFSLERSLAALGKTAEKSFKVSGCASCHHNTLPLVAYAQASRAGIVVDQAAEKKMMNYLSSMIKPMAGILFEGSGVVPDLPVSAGYILEALSAQSQPAGNLTAAMVHNLALQQLADGRWVGFAPRPPLESGDIQATAYAIRAITLYPIPGRREEMDQRVAAGARWLRSAVPGTTEEHTMRILGLKWAGFDAREYKEAAQQLIRMQRADGGWGQLPTLPSDAYATAKAVYAINEVFGAGNSFALGGLTYLRKTQEANGTWHVKTRSYALQPLKDTDFPHGRDQWISAAATSWAVIALAQDQAARMHTKETVPTRRNSSPERVAQSTPHRRSLR